MVSVNKSFFTYPILYKHNYTVRVARETKTDASFIDMQVLTLACFLLVLYINYVYVRAMYIISN